LGDGEMNNDIRLKYVEHINACAAEQLKLLPLISIDQLRHTVVKSATNSLKIMTDWNQHIFKMCIDELFPGK
jgi:hypothetical protein